MSREYIKDEKGNDRRTSDGERLFYSTGDGDSDPETNQTVYKEDNGSPWFNSKTDSKYDPSTGEFKE